MANTEDTSALYQLGSMGKYDPDVMSPIWKEEMATLGYVLCPRSDCRMGFLSVKGIDAHVRQCTGSPRPGEYVACSDCGIKFKTFCIMERHKSKNHSSTNSSADQPRPHPILHVARTSGTPTMALPLPPSLQRTIKQELQPGFRTYERNRHQFTEQDGPSRFTATPDIFSDVEPVQRTESLEEKHRRILTESRRLSTARKPGRPSKIQNMQFQELIRHQINQRTVALSPVAGTSRVMQMRTEDGRVIDFSSPHHQQQFKMYTPSTIHLPRPPTLDRMAGRPHRNSPVIGIEKDRPLSRQSDFSSVSVSSNARVASSGDFK